MTRLFVAVWPPEEVVADLTALPRKDQRGVRFVHPDNWHLTLRFLGEANPDAVIAALDGIEFAPAEIHLGPGVDVLGDRALVLPATGLDDVAAAVAERTRHLGEPPRKRFVGHLTLARLKPYAQLPHAMGMSFEGAFALEEIALVQSRLHPDGARYDTLATWPVRGDATV
jgi:2'-5' RNA ligase